MEMVNHHISDAVMQLMYWNAGTFRFRVPIQRSVQSVPSLEWRACCLDATGRVDEGRALAGQDADRDGALSDVHLGLLRGGQSRYLKSDICLCAACLRSQGSHHRA